jgi:hypothetical protein
MNSGHSFFMLIYRIISQIGGIENFLSTKAWIKCQSFPVCLCQPISFASEVNLEFHHWMKIALATGLASLLTIVSTNAVASGPSVSGPILLWPKGAPDEKGGIGEEHDTTKPDDGLVSGKRVIRLTNVSEPTLTLYRPSKSKANGAAVVVCPGGGYGILAMDLEGTEIRQWLNSIGVMGVLLND